MEKTDPHATHHYSHEQLAKAVFEMELYHLKTDNKWNMETEVIKAYLKERITEIKERWK